jgi:hypothetical protein
MLHKTKINSRFVLNGFTINPITERHILVNIMRGLGEYQDKHLCDYSKGVIHKNYLGKIVMGPFATYIENTEQNGLVGHCILDNGYYTIRIWNNTFPAKIQFDLFLENDLNDTDLILDHLCAPAVPNDGFGIFDYTYSTEKIKLLDSRIRKDNENDSSYIVNDKINFLDEDKNKWNVTLNQLKDPECYYCNKKPVSWIFIDEMQKVHVDFKSVLACENHIKNGRIRELSSTLGLEEGLDFYSSDQEKKFAMEKIVDAEGKVLYTENKEMRDE